VLDVVVRDEFVDRGEIARADSLEELTCKGLAGIGFGSGHGLAILRRWAPGHVPVTVTPRSLEV
jgi:hypothetical protein